MHIEYNVVPAIHALFRVFYSRFLKLFNCRTWFIIPYNEQYRSKLRWFSAAYIFKHLSFFLMHFIVPMGFQGESLLYLIYILAFKCCFQNATFLKIKISRNFSKRHFFYNCKRLQFRPAKSLLVGFICGIPKNLGQLFNRFDF